MGGLSSFQRDRAGMNGLNDLGTLQGDPLMSIVVSQAIVAWLVMGLLVCVLYTLYRKRRSNHSSIAEAASVAPKAKRKNDDRSLSLFMRAQGRLRWAEGRNRPWTPQPHRQDSKDEAAPGIDDRQDRFARK